VPCRVSDTVPNRVAGTRLAAPPAVLADALGVSPGTAMRHAFLGGADWSAYAIRRGASTSNDGTRQDVVASDRNLPAPGHQELPGGGRPGRA
jgi:hypothetical protein